MANLPSRRVRGERRLKPQAARADQSLNEFRLARMSEIARLPTIPEIAARLREREPYDGPSSATLIRAERRRR
jgi:hypothetical protein